jgi:DNA-binding NtrC family response regulator
MQTTAGAILIVDDEFAMRDSLSSWFRDDGHEVVAAESGEQALRCLQERSFDVALVDIRMPGMDGMELLERIQRVDPRIQIIIVTAFAAVDTAVRALKQGALDYVTKPVDPDELSHVVARAIEQHRKSAPPTDEATPALALGAEPIDEIVGQSPAIQRVRALIAQVASTSATVLIRGESGTGKELIARAIHAASPRRFFSLIPVNCGALTETLLESELFGHEKGAFTGAQYRRKGRLELADGGTLFLDEVATLSPKSQVDLLRVLETKELTRLGGTQSIKVDFRVVSASNESLEQLVKERRFREDLYYRINVFTIDAPPLRDRLVDLPLLARHFVRRLSAQLGKRIDDVAPDALARLAAHPWPGNVRELANAIERAIIVAPGPLISAADLALGPAPEGSAAATGSESLVEIEHQHIRRVLEQAGWNITRAAAVLKVDRQTLYSKIKKYGLHKQ